MRLIARILSAFGGMLLPGIAHASHAVGHNQVMLVPGWSSTICNFLTTCAPEVNAGAEALRFYLFETVVGIMEIVFVALAAIMLFVYALTLIFGSHEEGAVTKTKTGYAYAIAGAAMVGLAHLLANAFSHPLGGTIGQDVVDVDPLNEGIGNVLTYFSYVLGIALIFNVVYQAFRLIIAQEDGEYDKAKKRLLFGFIGVAIVLLANVMISAFNVEIGADPGVIAIEIRGIATFLLAIFGFLAVLSIMVAGVLLVVSVDEGLKDKAKTIVKTAVIALAVILAAFALVTTLIRVPVA